MRRYPGDADSRSFSADELAAAAALQAYAGRVAPEPSATFVEGVMAATALLPVPVVTRGPRAQTARAIGTAAGRIRTAFGQLTGGAGISMKVRAQAGALLLVVALALSAGAVLAAAGAVTVVHWITAPQETVTATHSPDGSDPAAGGAGRPDGYHASDRSAGATPSGPGARPIGSPTVAGSPTVTSSPTVAGSPGNCGNGVGSGNGVGNGNGVGGGIGCGNKTSSPTSQPTATPISVQPTATPTAGNGNGNGGCNPNGNGGGNGNQNCNKPSPTPKPNK